MAIVRIDHKGWWVDSLLMSCRIIGRTIETVFLNEVVNDAVRAGVARVWGEYLPTAKNKLVEGFYAREGFSSSDGGRLWSLDVRGKVRPQPPWVVIER